MPLYKQLPEDLTEVDIIIAGGGAAGCIVAGRLAAADPSLSILVIEWGRDNYQDPMVRNPMLWKFLFPPAAKSSIFYVGNKAPQLADRVPIVPAGGILGGGSSINVQMYTRAQRSDFDSWNTPGWSTEDLIPYMKKLETYHGPGSPTVHGYHGPVHISDSGFRSKDIMDDMLQAASSQGYPEIVDLQDLDSNNGYQRWLRNNSLDGKRQDTAHTYLHPLLQDGKHPHLHVLVEHQVSRVLFDDGSADDQDLKANGVEFLPNPEFASPGIPAIDSPSPRKVTARKLVVLSAGACGTPLILERSGVGNPSVLEKAGVPVRLDLPGVGADYQDHHLTCITYKTSLTPEDTPDRFYAGTVSPQEAIEKRDEILRWNTVDIAAKIRPTEDEVDALGPEFKKAWERDFKGNENRPLMLSAVLAGLLGTTPATHPSGQYLSVVNYTAYPYSRGHIHITSPDLPSLTPTPSVPASSPSSTPKAATGAGGGSGGIDFDVGYFTDPFDLDIKKLVWGYKKTREIMRRTALYRGEFAPGHPAFPAGSAAACIDLPPDTSLLAHLRSISATSAGDPDKQNGVNAAEIKIENLVYTPEDDAAIETWLRKVVNTTWHSLGTCKMASRDAQGVVDSNLNVYGTRGLKIIDLSIVPENVGANTCNTAMTIGEKGADLVSREVLGVGLTGRGELIV